MTIYTNQINLSSAIGSGLLSGRPSPGQAGTLYLATDVNGGTLYRDNGSSWTQTAAGVNELLTNLKGGNWNVIYTDGSGVVNELALGAAGTALVSGGASSAPSFALPALPYLLYEDRETQNTSGGTFTSGAWRTRTLNTEVVDTGNHGSLSSNQVTLDAGSYIVFAMAQVYVVGRHQLRIQDITNTATKYTGMSNYSGGSASFIPGGMAYLAGYFTLSGSAAIELQHQCEATVSTLGFGVEGNFTGEVFASLVLWKVA